MKNAISGHEGRGAVSDKAFLAALTAATTKGALLSLLKRYSRLPAARKERLKRRLARTADGRFYIPFLNRGGGEAVDREKACAWLLARKTFGLPYDGERVRRIIETETNLEDLRNSVYQAVADTYREAEDLECSRRISLQARTGKKRVVCGRFSRAFYIDALLLANAKLVPSGRLAGFLGELKKKAARLRYNSSYLSGEIQRLEKSAFEPEISLAQIAGGLAKIKKALLDYETELIRKFEAGQLMADFAGARRTVDGLRTAIRKFENGVAELPGRSPAYMVFFQRIFPIDAIYLGLLNELAEPFFGEDPHLHRLLAGGLRQKAALHGPPLPAAGGPRAIVYAAENHNHAAEILQAHVWTEIPPAEHEAVHGRVQFLNTVIGKMSGVVSDPAEITAQGLTTITPGSQRAFLVEAFNRILVSQIHFAESAGDPPFRRGIAVFEEKKDLLPFEEAKLYGHNATHALAAYIAAVAGVQRIADLERVPGVLPFLRAAFIEESGPALVHKHTGIDPLFTPEGYRAYGDDLLERMTNPYLRDTTERVGRDPARKLGWDDRLIGTMRVALHENVRPRRHAVGAAAAAATVERGILDGETPIETVLRPLWSGARDKAEEEAVLELVRDGLRLLKRWRAAGFPHLEELFAASSAN